METMNRDTLVMIFMATLFIVLALGFVWFSFRASAKAAEILKIYAEKGEEPPQSVTDAVIGLAWGFKPKAPAPPKPQTRSRHFSDFASCAVFAIGAAGIAWWRAPEPGEDPGALMILAIVVALIFAAGGLSHLVTALHIRDGQ